MNIHSVPRETVEADRAGYLEFQAREVVRDLIRLHGRSKTEFLLSMIFDDEAKVIHQ